MPKKVKRFSKQFKKKPTDQQRARNKRALEASIRLIAKQEGITIREARQIYKDNALIEWEFERPKKYVRRRFIKIGPNAFREIPEGKKIAEENARGPVRDERYLLRVNRMKQYWQFVDILKQEYKITTKQARARITRGKNLGLNVRAMEGFASGEYPISSRMIKELFG